MSGVLEAVNALTLLTGTVIRAAEQAQRVSQIIQQAQAEGRDLSDKEKAEVRQARAAAMARWDGE